MKFDFEDLYLSLSETAALSLTVTFCLVRVSLFFLSSDLVSGPADVLPKHKCVIAHFVAQVKSD